MSQNSCGTDGSPATIVTESTRAGAPSTSVKSCPERSVHATAAGTAARSLSVGFAGAGVLLVEEFGGESVSGSAPALVSPPATNEAAATTATTPTVGQHLRLVMSCPFREH